MLSDSPAGKKKLSQFYLLSHYSVNTYVDHMLNDLALANNQIVESISKLSVATQEVTDSSSQAESLSTENLENADKYSVD